MAIRTPELWTAHGGVRGVYPRASKLLHYQRIKLQDGINQELKIHTDARLLDSKLFSKCGVFWDQMAAEVESFRLHLVTNSFREAVSSARIVELCTVVLTMMRFIWRELRKVQVESETAYGSAYNVVMVGRYLWCNLQAHRFMDDFLRDQFRQHP